MNASASGLGSRGASLVAVAVLLVGCAGQEAKPPALAAPPVEIGSFIGEIDPEAGTFTIRPDDAGRGAGRSAIEPITGVMLSNASTPVVGTTCPGAAPSLSAAVKIVASPYSSTTLYTGVYAQIETLSPPTGSQGCNSVAHPGGFTNTGLGLWSYPSLGNPSGAVATWSFANPTGTKTTFTGKVYGTPVTVSATKVVFVTSSATDGNLGGLSGADAICSTAATTGVNAGRLPAGTYRAFVSVTGTNAASRVVDAAHVRPDGAVVAFSKADLLASGALVAVNVTESGGTYAPPTGKTPYAWTGSTTAGVLDSYNCVGWSTTTGGSAYAGVGNVSQAGTSWASVTGAGNWASCLNERGALYCFQQ
ncbi:MAG TPA: hypothetical protein VFM45_12650 [Anaeromyxobacteraceae bacterium]|nr:hypothetical protein [Anaeromyxobacteraceae bacterium]